MFEIKADRLVDKDQPISVKNRNPRGVSKFIIERESAAETGINDLIQDILSHPTFERNFENKDLDYEISIMLSSNSNQGGVILSEESLELIVRHRCTIFVDMYCSPRSDNN